MVDHSILRLFICTLEIFLLTHSHSLTHWRVQCSNASVSELLGDGEAVIPAISHLQYELMPELGDCSQAAVAVMNDAHARSKTRRQTRMWSRLELLQHLLRQHHTSTHTVTVNE